MRDLIERFYARAWNSWDDAAVTGLLDERFVFRGSLGDEVTGRDGFRGYRDKVRAAFPDSTTRSSTWSPMVTTPPPACGTPAITAGTSSDSRPPAPS